MLSGLASAAILSPAQWGALLLILLLAWALRLYRLDVQSIWWDEARNLHAASQPLAQIAALPELDIHPPAYFYLLHFWQALAGQSEFALRFLSVLFGVLTVPLLYRLGADWFDRRVALASALVVGLSPVYVAEAQVVRFYTLSILLSALSMLLFARWIRARTVRATVLYILASAAALLTHYAFAYVLVAQNLVLGLLWLGRWARKQEAMVLARDWILMQLAVVLLFAPQVPIALRQLGVYGNPSLRIPALGDYLWQVAQTFAAGIEIDPRVAGPLTLALVGLIVLGVIAGRRRARIAPFSWLLVSTWLAVPVLAYYVVLLRSPEFAPRYILIASPPFMLLLGCALATLASAGPAFGAAGYRFRLLAPVAVLLVGVPSLISLNSHFFDERSFQDDTRALGHFLAQETRADDLVLSDIPFTLEYYYHGPGELRYLFVNIHDAADKLTALARGKARVFVVHEYQADTDPRGVIPFLLSKYGIRAGEKSVRGYDVTWFQVPPAQTYRLEANAMDAAIEFGGELSLTGYSLGGKGEAPQLSMNGSGWAVMNWRALHPLNSNYKVSVSLFDGQGHLAAQEDRTLLNDNHLATSFWQPGTDGLNVFSLELLPGAPPRQYEARVAVYDPETGKRLPVGGRDSYPLGTLTVVPPPVGTAGQSDLQIEHPLKHDFNGLQLLGCDLPDGPVAPGGSLTLTLYWRAGKTIPTDDLAAVSLGDTGDRAEARPAGETFLTSEWPAGTIVRQWVDLSVPRDTEMGRFPLRLRVVDSAKRGIGALELAQVEIAGRARVFTAPPIATPKQATVGDKFKLLGYGLDAPGLHPGSPLKLTLYWQSLAPADTSYTVFVHLLDANNTVRAQRDQEPANGEAATNTWQTNEIIADRYEIPVPADLPEGEYRIEIGMYDPASGTRLPIREEGGQATADHLILQTLQPGK